MRDLHSCFTGKHYVVTGGAGFIGSHIVKHLVFEGSKVTVVDDLKNSKKYDNIRSSSAGIVDVIHPEMFSRPGCFNWKNVSGVFHQGATTDTMEQDGNLLIQNNTQYSKWLILKCQAEGKPIVYASSAAVYGNDFGNSIANKLLPRARDERDLGNPLNVYGFSKMLVDKFVLENKLPKTVGLRYFNVYGKGEEHKKHMRSMVNKIIEAAKSDEAVSLFSSDNDQIYKRDFIYVKDVVKINLYLMFKIMTEQQQGIFNVGTGTAHSFEDVVDVVSSVLNKKIDVKYKPMPESVKKVYQTFTCADLRNLRATGYNALFATLRDGVEMTIS